ncbi:hypothetical protein DFS34DRAFT_159643 [Phlyctochytrium arcticum]|nr:hypothetical protein DFS34DRAFT_159643 [Phlyctochytrium arcticum]
MASTGQEAKLLLTLIHRVTEKLPVNSGRPLSSLEGDQLFAQGIRSIIEASQWRLREIISALSNVLDGVSRSYSTAPDDPNLSLDILHSQLFVLRLLGDCTTFAWKSYRDSLSSQVYVGPDAASSTSSTSTSAAAGSSPRAVRNALNVPPRNPSSSSTPTSATSDYPIIPPRSETGSFRLGTPRILRPRATISSGNAPAPQHKLSYLTSATDHALTSAGVTTSMKLQFVDPPPLDESLGKFLLAVITRFFYTTAAAINTDTVSHSFGSSLDSSEPNSSLHHTQFTLLGNTPDALALSLPLSSGLSQQELVSEIQKAAGKILFYLSAASWPVVFSKIKARLSYLSQMGSMGSNSSGGASIKDDQSGDREGGDLTELRYLEWCCMNRQRLGMVLGEITHFSKNFAKRSQFLTAIVLRRAIWNWIETFPSEFQSLCQRQGRLEGNPDVLFDNFQLNSDSSRRKAVFWPVQTMLLVLCPDILYTIGMVGNSGDRQRILSSSGSTNQSLTKKASFLENVRKNVRSKVGEVSALCCVDLVKASTYVSKADGGPLRVLGAAVEVDLREKLFDVQKPLTLTTGGVWDDSGSIDHRLLAECVAALYKVNPWNTLRTIVPLMLETNIGQLYKSAFAKAMWTIVAEDDAPPWIPTIDASLAAPLRQLFLDATIRERHIADAKGKRVGGFRGSQTDRKLKKAQQEEANEKLQMVWHILRTWARCPLLMLARDSGVIQAEELRQLLAGLTSSLMDAYPAIRQLSAYLLTRLMTEEMIPYWDGTESDWRNSSPVFPPMGGGAEAAMRVFWRSSSQILLGVSRTVLEEMVASSETCKDLLSLGNEIMRLRNGVLIRRGTTIARCGSDIPDRFAASVAMEVAILVALSGNWGESAFIGKTAASWLEAALEEGELIGEVKDIARGAAPTSPLMENLWVYKDLCQVVLGSGGAGGQKALYKRARALIRTIRVPTAGNVGAWEEVYKSWKAAGVGPSGRRRSGSTVSNSINDLSTTGNDNAASPDAYSTVSANTPTDNDDSDVSGRRKIRRTGSGLGIGMFASDEKSEWVNHTAFLCALGGVCLKASAHAADQQSSPSQRDQGSPTRAASTSGVSRRKSTGSAAASFDALDSSSSDAAGVPWTGMVNAQLTNAYSGARATVEKFVVDLVELMLCDSVAVRESVKECLGLELTEGMYGILFSHCCQMASTQLFDAATDEPRLNARNTLLVDYMASILRLALDRPDVGSVLTGPSLRDVNLGSIIVNLLRYLDTLTILDPTSLRIRVRLCMAIEVLIVKRDIIGITGEMKVRRDILQALMGWKAVEGVTKYMDIPEDAAGNMMKLQRDADMACVKAMVALLDGLPLQGYVVTMKGAKGRATGKFFDFLFKVLQRTRAEDDPSTAHQHQNVALREHTIQALTHLVAANIEVELPYVLDQMYHGDECVRGSFAAVLTNLLRADRAKERLSHGLGDPAELTKLRYAKLLELLTEREDGLDIAVALGEGAPVADVDDIAALLVSIFEGRGKALEFIQKVVKREVDGTDTPANLFRRNSMATRLLTIYAKSQGNEYLVRTLQPLISELAERCPPMSFEVDPIKLAPTDNPETNLRNLQIVSQGVLDSIVGPGASKVPIALREACLIVWRLVGSRFPDARVTAVGGFLFLRFFCPAIVSPDSHGIVPASELRRELRRGLVLITKVVQNLANNVLFGVKESFMSGANDVLRENVARVHGFLRDVSAPVPTSEIPPKRPKGVSELETLRLHRHLALNLDKVEKLLQQMSASTAASSQPPAGGALAAAARQLARRSVSQLAGRKEHITPSRSVGSSPPPSPKRDHRSSYRSNRGGAASMNLDVTDSRSILTTGSVAPSHLQRNTFEELSTLLAHLGPLPELPPTRSESSSSGVETSSLSRGSTVNAAWEAESDVLSFSPVFWIKGFRVQVPVVFRISSKAVHVVGVKKDSVTNLSNGPSTNVNDTYHASEIEDIVSARDQEFVLRVLERSGPAKGTTVGVTFTSPKADNIVHTVQKMVSRFRLGRTSHSSLGIAAPPGVSRQRCPLTPKNITGALINVALANFVSEQASVRRAAYELLCAVGAEYGIDINVGKIGSEHIASGKGIFIPSSNESFVMDISTKLAKSHPELTLGFLSEAAFSLTKSPRPLKRYTVEYMVPWLPNLVSHLDVHTEPPDDTLDKILDTLIEATVKEQDMSSLFRSRIWRTIGMVDVMAPVIIDRLLDTAVESAARPSDIEELANTVNTIAAASAYPVSGKVISRLRKAIASTSYRCCSTLVDHGAWTEIAILIRLVLVVSFGDWNNVDYVLPELFYVISMVVGLGSPLVRNSVHGIVVNTVHALSTAGRVDHAGRKALTDVAAELTDPKLSFPFGVHGEAVNGEVASDVSLSGLEMVVKCLLDVMTAGTSDLSQSSIWKARWMSLVASTAFQYNPAIQPRAFIVLGCLARDEVDDDLLYQILVALRGALTLFEENDCPLIVSIVMSLCNIVGGLSADSRYLKPMFWLSLALIQIGHVPVFQSALGLLVVVLRTLERRGSFEATGVSVSLLRARDVVEEVASKLDNAVGIAFKVDNFPFAVSANLLKGLKHPATKTATIGALETFLDVSMQESEGLKGTVNRLGYIVPLLPSADRPLELWIARGFFSVTDGMEVEDDIDEYTGRVRERERLVRIRQQHYRSVFEHLAVTDDTATSVLLVSTLFTMLETAEYDGELSTIYEFLAEAAEIIPDVFALISDLLMQRMNQVIQSTQTMTIIDAVQRIMRSLMAQRSPGLYGSLSYASSQPNTPTSQGPSKQGMSPSHRRSAPPTPSTYPPSGSPTAATPTGSQFSTLTYNNPSTPTSLNATMSSSPPPPLPSSGYVSSQGTPVSTPLPSPYPMAHPSNPFNSYAGHQASSISGASQATSTFSPADALQARLAELGFPGLMYLSANQPVHSGQSTSSLSSASGHAAVFDAATFAHVGRARKVKNAALACELVDAIIGL